MEDLLKDYLEKSPRYKFNDVSVHSFIKGVYSVSAKITHQYNPKIPIDLEIDVWDLLAFLHSSKQ